MNVKLYTVGLWPMVMMHGYDLVDARQGVNAVHVYYAGGDHTVMQAPR